MSLLLLSRPRVVASVASPPPEPPSGATSASLTRYDSTSGTALFRGTIPLPPTGPHAVVNAAGLANKRVLVNGVEPAGGIWIEALEPRHTNGNLKLAYVEFEATCGSSETVPCTVDNAARTVPDRTALVDAVQRAPLAWCRQPTFFFVTDPAYRVSCRLTALPLVTMATVQANCPAAWHASLTTEFDSRLDAVTPNSGTASYNMHYALMCRAEMTGNPADAVRGLAGFIDVDGVPNAGGHKLSYYTPATESYSPAMRLGSNQTGNQFGVGGEQWDLGPSLLLGYAQTGAQQLGTSAELQGAFGGQAAAISAQWGARYNLRRNVSNWLVGRLLGRTRTVQSIGGGWTWNPNALTPATELTNRLNTLETNANTLTTANGVPTWLQGFNLYGYSATAYTGNELASFQFGVAVYPLMGAYLNIAQDARILTALDGIRDFLRSQLNPYTHPSGFQSWAHPYAGADPSTLATTATAAFLTTIFSSNFAFAYARNNADTESRDIADALVDERMWDRNVVAGGGGETLSWKVMGEWIYMMPHSAAWRAGVPWNGWEVTP